MEAVPDKKLLAVQPDAQSSPLEGLFEWNNDDELVFTRMTDEYIPSLHSCLLDACGPVPHNSCFNKKVGVRGLY